MFAGRPFDPRRQRLRHYRQTGPPGHSNGIGEEFHVPDRRRSNVPLSNERFQKRKKANEVRGSKGRSRLKKTNNC